jgi:hypothetical protein
MRHRRARDMTPHTWRVLMQYRLTDAEARSMVEGYGHPEVDDAPIGLLAAGETPPRGDPRVWLGPHNMLRDESVVLCYACEEPWSPELAARPCPGDPRPEPITGNVSTELAAVGRNNPCPCGSGIKFKRCHGT